MQDKSLYSFAKKRPEIQTYTIHKSSARLFWERFVSKKFNIVALVLFCLILIAMIIALAFVKNSPSKSLDDNSIYVNNLPVYFDQIVKRDFERGPELDFIRNIASKEAQRAFLSNENPVFKILYDSAYESGGSLTVNTDIVTLVYNPYDLIKAINLLNNTPNSQIIIPHIPYLGTNANGIDIYSRLNVSIFVTLVIILLSIIFNIFIGFSLAAFYVFNRNKWYGNLIDKVATVLNAIPEIIWIFLLCIFFSTNWYGILVAFILISWVSYYEIAKNEIYNLSQKEFILAAKAIGMNKFQITYRQLFSNVLPSLIIMMVDRLAINILIVASLAFLDLITEASNLNIGSVLKEALLLVSSNPSYLIVSALYITVFSVVLKLFNVALAQTYNPKLAK
ncbi:ABC transporter permease [Metamycoplasma neophronis]|uniref:ABC transporter permease subunit n=1 Tax=Metamycoplasma neophronis TaxID=872983 RepID=A0ABY2Z3L7_9BACT|nr:ABC transporter permease subunit [Metamycoplasma neophronis]TPR53397.1 ABC transporter permease subunit [Metamycoplasma neophronis]